jgi:hypothetical protein
MAAIHTASTAACWSIVCKQLASCPAKLTVLQLVLLLQPHNKQLQEADWHFLAHGLYLRCQLVKHAVKLALQLQDLPL